MKIVTAFLAVLAISGQAFAECKSSTSNAGSTEKTGTDQSNTSQGIAVREPSSALPTSVTRTSERADIVRDENGSVLGLRQGGSRLRERPREEVVLKKELPPNSIGTTIVPALPSQPIRPGVDNPGKPGGPGAIGTTSPAAQAL